MRAACFERTRRRYQLKHRPVLSSSRKMSLERPPLARCACVNAKPSMTAPSPGSVESAPASSDPPYLKPLLSCVSSPSPPAPLSAVRSELCAQSPVLSDPLISAALPLNPQMKQALSSTQMDLSHTGHHSWFLPLFPQLSSTWNVHFHSFQVSKFYLLF